MTPSPLRSRTSRPSPAAHPAVPVEVSPVAATSKCTPSAAARVLMPLPSRSSTMGVLSRALTWAADITAMSAVWKAVACAVVIAAMSTACRPAICSVVKATIWSVVSARICAVVKALIWSVDQRHPVRGGDGGDLCRRHRRDLSGGDGVDLRRVQCRPGIGGQRPEGRGAQRRQVLGGAGVELRRGQRRHLGRGQRRELRRRQRIEVVAAQAGDGPGARAATWRVVRAPICAESKAAKASVPSARIAPCSACGQVFGGHAVGLRRGDGRGLRRPSDWRTAPWSAR
jgi:hypothetical protein